MGHDELRRAILADVVQRLRVLLPLMAGALGLTWSVAVDTSPASLAATVGGACLGALFFCYILMFEGESIKRRILEKRRKAAEEERRRTVDEALVKMPSSVDAAYREFSRQLDRTREALACATSVRQAMFAAPVDRTAEDVTDIVVAAADDWRDGEMQVREFIQQATSVLADIAEQCSETERDVAEARENLEALRGRVDAAHRAMERLQALGKRETELE